MAAHPARDVREYLYACDASAVLRGGSLRMTEDLAALQANALAAQDTIDGFLTAAIEAESTPGLLESHSALASELRSEVSRKTVAIESVLVRIDAALELLEDIASPKHGEALHPVADSIEGTALSSAHEERVSALLKIVDALKHGEALDPVADSTLFIRGGWTAGGPPATLVTRLVSAGDVQLTGLSVSSRAVIGRALRFFVRYVPSHPVRDTGIDATAHRAAGLDPTASANAELAARIRVVVTGGVAAGVLVTPLPVEGEGVVVNVDIPGTAAAGDVFEITRVTVGGLPVVASTPMCAFPLLLSAVSSRSLVSPGKILEAMDGMMISPCVSCAGELFLPVGKKLRVEGSRQCSFDVKPVFGVEASHAVALDEATRTLLIGASSSPFITAFDADTLAVRWRSPPEVSGSCRGIAVLPAAGVCVATLQFQSGNLVVVQLSDGALLASMRVDSPLYAAAYPETNTVFVSIRYAVEAFQWDGTALRAVGRVNTADTGNNRPVAVVPPGPGCHHAHLVVGTCHNTPQLDVFRLPGLEFVCQATLPDRVQLYGLAADATGTTLVAIVTRRNEALLMPWPLPGMPPLL